eukprot:gene16408-16586_t
MAESADDIFGQVPRKTTAVHELGCGLDALSIEELDLRIAALQAEIQRLETTKKSKIASRSAADHFFKT